MNTNKKNCNSLATKAQGRGIYYKPLSEMALKELY